MLLTGNVGHADWWSKVKQMGTPLVQYMDDTCEVTFIWRDPQGNEFYSSVCTVYIEINCLTDHHQDNPQQLTRISGTDVWFWKTIIPSDWHGTYFFIPVDSDNLAPIHYLKSSTSGEVDITSNHRKAHSQWWRSILHLAISDPLNQSSPIYCIWGQSRSLLYLPNAKRQPIWQAWDKSENYQCNLPNKSIETLQQFTWQSTLLQNSRSVWLLETQKASDSCVDKPFILMLDGENWAELMPLFSVLQRLTDDGYLAPAIYAFVGNVSLQQRPQDLGCNPLFWQAVNDELFVDIECKINRDIASCQRGVIGQSLGGLAAMFVGLSRPGMFDYVLCQSGSFWWPTPRLMHQWMNKELSPKERENAWLTTQVQNKNIANHNIKLVMQIGSKEKRLSALNHHFYRSLMSTGHQVTMTEYCGGHDQVCWREGLITSLIQWLKSTTTCLDNSPSYLTNHDIAHCGR
ncbi:enterochelin esterase [uncultured Shewanella sp.]|uniref:enterochelin esterase n=1 Tax=uncultured Shewanella sp. TaxID=173975 RepID=UPI002630B34A|nr:enterochelin esterase [uncultured Shewanella sp.]